MAKKKSAPKKTVSKASPKKKKAAPPVLTTGEVVKLLAPWRDSHRRTAYKPIVKKGDGELTASKFSGHPWLAKGEAWPTCKCCQRPLQLFLQLNLNDLPKALRRKFGKGLLQLFYCRNNGSPECLGDGFDYFDNSVSLCRVVQPKGAGAKSDVPKEKGYFPAKTITGWKEFEDLPCPEDHELLGLKYDYDFDANTLTIRCKEPKLKLVASLDDDEVAETIADSAEGDKLAGWPKWIQSAEYCRCPKCKSKLEVVFQIDSEVNVPFMFGDAGIGHIQQCPQHPEVVAFGWACC